MRCDHEIATNMCRDIVVLIVVLSSACIRISYNIYLHAMQTRGCGV